MLLPACIAAQRSSGAAPRPRSPKEQTMEPQTEVDKAIQNAIEWKPKWHVRLRQWFAGLRKTHHRNAERLARYVATDLGLEVGAPRFGEPKGLAWIGFGYGWKFPEARSFILARMWSGATHVRAVISPALSDRAVTLEFYREDVRDNA